MGKHDLHAIILATGSDSQSKRDLPSVLDKIHGTSMIQLTIDRVRDAGIEDMIIVVSNLHDGVMEHLGTQVRFAVLEQPLGTGHAVLQALPLLAGATGSVVICHGDMPLLRPATLRALVDGQSRTDADAVILTSVVDDPRDFGRIVRHTDGRVARVVGGEDCTPEELAAREVDVGVYCFDAGAVRWALSRLTSDTPRRALRLADAVGILVDAGRRVETLRTEDLEEVLRIDARHRLDFAERLGHIAHAESLYELIDASVTLERQRQSSLFEAVQQPIITTTRGGRVTGLNPAGASLFGEPSQVYGRHIRDLLPFIGHPSEGTGGPLMWQGRLTTPSGEAVDLEVLGTRIGEVQLSGSDVYVVHDISRHAELNRMREQLLYAVAHELRGPVGALDSALEILTEDWTDLEPDEVERLLRVARRTAARLRNLMEGMLSAGSIQRGHLRIHAEPTEVATLVDDARELIEHALAARGQRLEWDVPGDLPRVRADPRYAPQVLVNLLSNAGKYSPDGETIRVRAGRASGSVRVQVEDRGPGISSAGQARLFEPFYRAQSTEDTPGLGLGLAISKSIVEAHGGRIGINSRPGHGTTAWFTLPLEHASTEG